MAVSSADTASEEAQELPKPEPHVLVLFGATGDLARRKPIPGLFHLEQVGLMPDKYRIVGTSLDELDDDAFCQHVREALSEFCRMKVDGDNWKVFSERLHYVKSEADALAAGVKRAEEAIGGEVRRLHYLCMAESARVISIAFREPPKSMFRPDAGVGAAGPDHLTFDLADTPRLSLSFYGKRPGRGMHLEKASMQFSLGETPQHKDALEAYERLIHDAMTGDRTLFTTAEGVERLWEISAPLLEKPSPRRPYAKESWGPDEIDDLIAPRHWRLPVRAQMEGHRLTG